MTPVSPARSKAQRANPKSQTKKVDETRQGIVPQPSREPLPMKPRRGVFIALMTVFVAWVCVMLAMYVTTVRPRRHSAPSPSQPQPQPPAATAPAMAGQASATPLSLR